MCYCCKETHWFEEEDGLIRYKTSVYAEEILKWCEGILGTQWDFCKATCTEPVQKFGDYNMGLSRVVLLPHFSVCSCLGVQQQRKGSKVHSMRSIHNVTWQFRLNC